MQEKSLVKKNILQYIEIKGITKYEFYKKTGITRGVLDQNNGMSEENTAKFLVCFPEISPEWLLTGRGSMLKTKNDEKEHTRTREITDEAADLQCKSTNKFLDGKKNAIKNFPKENISITGDTTIYKELLERRDLELKELNRENGELNRQIGALQFENRSLKNEISTLKSENNRLTAENESLKNKPVVYPESPQQFLTAADTEAPYKPVKQQPFAYPANAQK